MENIEKAKKEIIRMVEKYGYNFVTGTMGDHILEAAERAMQSAKERKANGRFPNFTLAKKLRRVGNALNCISVGDI